MHYSLDTVSSTEVWVFPSITRVVIVRVTRLPWESTTVICCCDIDVWTPLLPENACEDANEEGAPLVFTDAAWDEFENEADPFENE